jgi:hypothetical protein
MYFKKRFGQCPHDLFSEWRDQEIRKLAAEGKSGKEILDEIGLSHCSSLTRSLLRNGQTGLREIRLDKGGVPRLEREIAAKGSLRRNRFLTPRTQRPRRPAAKTTNEHQWTRISRGAGFPAWQYKWSAAVSKTSRSA